MHAKRLQLNMDKTEFMWCTRLQHQLPVADVAIGAHQVTPSTSVRDLQISLDSDLAIWTHVLRTVSRCFAMLHQLPQSVLHCSQLYRHSSSWLIMRTQHYVVFYDLPTTLDAINWSASLIFDLRQPDHITNALASLFISFEWLSELNTKLHYWRIMLCKARSVLVSQYLSDGRVPIVECSSASSTAIFNNHSANGTNSSAIYYRQPFISDCRTYSLESATNWCPFCLVASGFSPETQDSFIWSFLSFPLFRPINICHFICTFSGRRNFLWKASW